MFFIEILLPKDYPNSHPMVYFIIPIYHINVNSSKYGKNGEPLGNVSFSTINIWKPENTIKKLLIDLYAIFYWPNPKSAYSIERAREYQQNNALYKKKVKYFTKKYATPGIPL